MFRNNLFATKADREANPAQGMEAVLLANRAKIVKFLVLRGAGDDAEDLFQDLWARLASGHPGPVANPLAYIMRAANNLMIDRYRSLRQQELRDRAWAETTDTGEISAETSLITRQQLRQVEQAIDRMGERAARIFRRYRIDGLNQRDIAAEMGVSLSTVEADLRKTYAALDTLKRQFDAQ